MATDGVQNIGNVNLGENAFCLYNFNIEKQVMLSSMTCFGLLVDYFSHTQDRLRQNIH